MEGPIQSGDINSTRIAVQILDAFRSRFKPLVKTYPVGKKFDITINAAGSFWQTEPDGVLVFKTIDNPDVTISDFFPKRSIIQNRTLWGICYFIGWIQEGRKPDKETVYWIYRGIIEEYSPHVMNPTTMQREAMTSSHPGMNTRVMATIISGALQTLLSQDIPESLEDFIGKDMRSLWREFYKWRYDKDDKLEEDIDWAEYCEKYQVCEACGLKHSDDNPLERAHIISAGANQSIYEESWNWLRIHRSHHAEIQHQLGWSVFLKSFPHLRPKVEYARRRAQC